jgi:hypothetical protein
MYDVTLWNVRITIVALERQVFSVCIVEVCQCQQYKMTFAALLPATIRYSYVCLGNTSGHSF